MGDKYYKKGIINPEEEYYVERGDTEIDDKYSFDGSKVYLRRLRKEDINEEYLSWFLDEVVQEFTSAGTRSLTKADVFEYMRYGEETKRYFMYAIIVKDNEKHIGNVKMGDIDARHMVSDLSLFIGDRSYWGGGIGTSAIKIGIELAFGHYRVRKLSGSIVSTNTGSVKLFTRAGWIIEATLTGHFIFGEGCQDRVIVSCFNPEYFEKRDAAYYPKSPMPTVTGPVKWPAAIFSAD